MAAPPKQLPAGRYFAAFFALIALLYALVFLTGSTRTPKLGLDLQGGTTVTLQAVTKNGKAPNPDQLGQAKRIIQQRVNGLGVAEADVITEGGQNIVISIPGRQGEAAKRIAGTAQLRFREVVGQPVAGNGAVQPTPTPRATAPRKATPTPSARSAAPSPRTSSQKRALSRVLTAPTVAPSPTASPAARASAKPSTKPGASGAPSPLPTASAPPSDAAIGEQLAKLPAQVLFNTPAVTCALLAKRAPGSTDDPTKQQVACSSDGSQKYLLGPAKVLGTDVRTANFVYDQSQGWKVTLSFTRKGQDKWTSLTQAALNKQLAIVLDGVVVSAPTVQAVQPGDSEITGQFTREEVQLLANQLKYGALPLSFSVQQAESVSPTLGSDQLKAGLFAGSLGLALVVGYSLFYYRVLGLVTIASLALSGTIIYAAVVLLGRQIGFTLSLAGIAGFIVAVGITADSFVVFFERLKDEVKEGRTMRSAVPRAWVRARRTILSADAVSFLAAAVLYWLAIGAVKGFAFTLGLSTVIDLVIVFLFTHPLVSVMSRSRAFASARFSGLGRLRVPEAQPVARTPRLHTAKES